MKEKKVTIYDVAEKLDVSTATVNRALNGKPKVSEKMRKIVKQTADEMGYKASKTASSLSRKPIKIGMVINGTILGFIKEVEMGARVALKELQDFKVSGDIYITEHDSKKEEFDSILWDMVEKGYDGIAMVPPSNETDLNDVINKIRSKGVVVGTAVSDLPTSNRNISVRNNGVIAGKMAAELLFWLVGNEPVALVTGFRDSIVHIETINGFDMFAEKASMNYVGVYEHRDDAELAYYLASRLIKERPDIKGIYFGSANSMSFCKRLKELGVLDDIKIVASDLLPGIVDYLKQGVISATIFQNPFEQGRKLIKNMYSIIAENQIFENDVQYLNPQIVMASNIELFE